MGALRDRFWELPLADLTRPEWEALSGALAAFPDSPLAIGLLALS